MTAMKTSRNTARSLKVKNILSEMHAISNSSNDTPTTVTIPSTAPSIISSIAEDSAESKTNDVQITNLSKYFEKTFSNSKQSLFKINEEYLDRLSSESPNTDFVFIIDILQGELERTYRSLELVLVKRRDMNLDKYCQWLNQGKLHFYDYFKRLGSIEQILVQVLDTIETKYKENNEMSYASIFEDIEKCSEQYAKLHTLCLYLKSIFDSSSEFHEIYYDYMESIEDEIIKTFDKLHTLHETNITTSSNVPSLEELIRILGSSVWATKKHSISSNRDSIISTGSHSHQLIFVNAQDSLVYENYKGILTSFDPLTTSVTDILALKIEEFTSKHESADYLYDLIEFIKIKYTELVGTYELLETEMANLKRKIIFDRWSQVLDFHCNELNTIIDNILPNALISMKNFQSKKFSKILDYYISLINKNVSLVEKYFKFMKLLSDKYLSHDLSKKVSYKKNELHFKWMKLKHDIPKSIQGVSLRRVDSISSSNSENFASSSNESPNSKINSNNINSKNSLPLNGGLNSPRKLRNSRRLRRSLISDQPSSKFSNKNGDELLTKLNRLSTLENIEEWKNLSKEFRRQSIGALIHQKLNIKPVVIKDADKLESPTKHSYSEYEDSDSEGEQTKRYIIDDQFDDGEVKAYTYHEQRMHEVDKTLMKQASTSTLRISESDGTLFGEGCIFSPAETIGNSLNQVSLFETNLFKEKILKYANINSKLPSIKNRGSAQLFFAKGSTGGNAMNSSGTALAPNESDVEATVKKLLKSCEGNKYQFTVSRLREPSDLKTLLK